MTSYLQHPVFFLFCLLGLAARANSLSQTHVSCVDNGSRGITIALWSMVLALALPPLFIDFHVGPSYSLIVHTGAAIFWVPLLVYGMTFLPPMPLSVPATAAVAAVIAWPELLRFDLLIGGIASVSDPRSGILLIGLPAILAFSQIRSFPDSGWRAALWTLFLGIVPACILMISHHRGRCSLVAAIGGAFCALPVQALWPSVTAAGTVAGVGGFLLTSVAAKYLKGENA